ncbi:MAG: hypothetical protein JNK51_01300 [Blastocatellia bacterium]|nr:hypothetical protein [Blastocatellia bacterium]
MFEQHLYEQELLAPEPQTGDLFQNYEIKSWEFSPRIYKILASSVIINVLAFVIIGQTNLLTMKGCDSPFVGRVCQVLDMAYIGAVMFGTERDYVDAAYERIDLGEADITMIDVSGEAPPLSYPEGYFQIANPQEFAMLKAQSENPGSGYLAPGIPAGPSSGPNMLSTVPKLPRANPNAVKGDVPKSPFSIEDDEGETVGKAGNRGRPGKLPGDPTNANANVDQQVADSNTNSNTPTVNPTDPVSGVEINKRPMVDLGNFVNELQANKEVNLQSEFIVNAQGKLDKNGRLDPKTFRFVEAKSVDENMIAVVKESIEAINVAGYLQYLKDLSGKDFRLQLQQDAENISAVVQSEMETDTRARSVKSAIDLAISIVKTRKTAADADQNDKDDLLLLENAKVEVDGKKVIIRFAVPKAVAHPMIQRKLAEQAAEAKKPSGNAMIKPNDNTAAK